VGQNILVSYSFQTIPPALSHHVNRLNPVSETCVTLVAIAWYCAKITGAVLKSAKVFKSVANDTRKTPTFSFRIIGYR
jgi:hypothetical protein